MKKQQLPSMSTMANHSALPTIIRILSIFVLLTLLALLINVTILVVDLRQNLFNTVINSINNSGTMVNNQLNNLTTLIASVQQETTTTTTNRTLITNASTNNQCGFGDPCFMTILEETFDKITNQTYTTCKRIVRPRGTPCATSCVRDGKCTGFIGASERGGTQTPQLREPYCNASSPYNCYGYCNSYLDCIKPNLLQGKIYATAVPSNFMQPSCINRACVFNVNVLRDVGGGAFGNLYSWYNKPSWELKVTPPQSNIYFDYGADFCEYILYDRFDSNAASTTFNLSEFNNPKNNKGCYDYHFEWDDVYEWCVYQYTCSRPNYFDSLRTNRFSPSTKRRRRAFSSYQQEEEEADNESEIRTLCTSILGSIYSSAIPPSTLSLSEDGENATDEELALKISSIQEVLANDDLEAALERIRMNKNQIPSSLFSSSFLDGGDTNDVEAFVMNNCFQSVIKPNATFILKPRTTLTGEFNQNVMNEVKNSFVYLPQLGYLSIDSRYINQIKDENITSLSDLNRKIAHMAKK